MPENSFRASDAIFQLNSYLYHLTNITPKHKLELFDKLVAPILNYGSQVWGFCEAKQIERTHLMFCKQLLGIKNATQNDFIYGELGRTSFYVHRIYAITKYWFKILQSDDRKYIKIIYNLMLRDIETKPNIKKLGFFTKKYSFKFRILACLVVSRSTGYKTIPSCS